MSQSDDKKLSSGANVIGQNSLKKKKIYIYIYILINSFEWFNKFFEKNTVIYMTNSAKIVGIQIAIRLDYKILIDYLYNQ